MEGANYLLLAPSRAGKSHYAVHNLFLRQPPSLYIDPKGTDDHLKRAAQRADVLRFYAAGYLSSHAQNCPFLALTGSLEYDIVEEAEKLLEWIVSLRMQNPHAPPVMLIVDEAGRFMNKQSNAIPALQKLICEGRGYGVSTAILCQHPNQVPNLFIENATYILTWPSMDRYGNCQGMSPIIVDYLKDHGYPMPEHARQWATKPYHGLMIDGSEYYHILPNGSLDRPTGQEVIPEHEEDPPEGGGKVEADPLPDAGAGTEIPVKRPEIPIGGGDGGGTGQGVKK